MVRKIKRTSDYQFNLDVANDNFIATPRASQRMWYLNRLVKEVADDLAHLNTVAPKMVAGAEQGVELADRAQAELDEQDIMEDWQIPIMREMANFVTESGGDVLEIGMGRGVASDFIQQGAPRSHTIIECNDNIVEQFPTWKQQYPGSKVEMVHGLWQDRWGELELYDGILFHTYPLTHEEFVEHVVQSATFTEHFFEPAAAKLRKDGVLTYLTNENDSISREHQRSLLRHFNSFTISQLVDLNIPEQTRDSCWLPQMIMIRAVK